MLLRHAKAEQHAEGGDFARKLTDRGISDAQALGVHMADLGVIPDLALVSGAARTRETFDLFKDGCGAVIAARVEAQLYNASDGQIRDVLKIIDPKVKTLMIVGHNPGIMDAAIRLARDGDINDLGRLRARFPPCALVVIAFDTDDWRDARASGGRLDLLVLPEDLTTRS